VNEIYPKEHRGLAQKILETGGTLISELPIAESPRIHHFPARNRIISGLSKATIIIEAKKKSGSLITAKFALEQNRDVFAVPGNIFSENAEGTNHLILEGAIPLVSKEEMLAQLNLNTAEIPEKPAPLSFDSKEEELLFEALREPRSIDELKNSLPLDLPVISQFLSLLELKGLVKNYGNTRYGRM
jgi:DNA processing protein